MIFNKKVLRAILEAQNTTVVGPVRLRQRRMPRGKKVFFQYLSHASRHDLRGIVHDCGFCGAKHWIDERSGGHINNPEFESCC